VQEASQGIHLPEGMMERSCRMWGGSSNNWEWARDALGKASIRKSPACHRIKAEGRVAQMRRKGGQWDSSGREAMEVQRWGQGASDDANQMFGQWINQ